MELTAWIVFLSAITFTMSQKMELCRIKADCVPTQPSNISFVLGNPKEKTKYLPPGPISLICEVTGDVDMIRWIRNNSDGESKIINSTLLNAKVGHLEDFPNDNKFPYTYRCIAYGKCCDEHRSPSITVVEPEIVIQDIKSDIMSFTPDQYFGYGKVRISCKGEGNNLTHVYWNRTDDKGNSIIFNTTSLDHNNDGVWQAKLAFQPNPVNVSYTYKCIAENKCCPTKISDSLKISYNPTFVCSQFGAFGLSKELYEIITIPSKRSVKISWKYDSDPEDTGLVISGISQDKTFNITVQEYVFHDLVPNKRYMPRYKILFNTRQGKSCATFPVVHGSFWTLPDDPSRPRNVTVIAEGITLNVSWLPPKYLNGEFKYYKLSWKNIDGNTSASINVTTTSFVLEDLEELTTYSIRVFAVNNVGIGNSSFLVSAETELLSEPTPTPTPNPTPNPRTTDNGSNTGAIAGGVVGAILFLILLLIIFLWVRRRNRIKEHERSVRLFQSMHPIENPMAVSETKPGQDAEPLPEKTDIPDELSYIVLLEDWEIASDNLKLLDKKLGGGQFGIVMQGLLTTTKGDSEVVAVKMLKDSAKESDLQDLMTELTILKEVNKVPHPNVIRLIGGCSIGGKLHVITELCTGGSLRHLLINSRVYPSEENSSNYINLSSTLNHRQLVKIAADISNGMVHLSSQKFVHRDLAARNILIGEDNMAKVSDFGLARDVGGAEEYIRNNQNLLPVKWMALESLLHGRFTIASDVWSYGVLLHEITTLGEEPYKNISPYNIVSHVGSGCRMSQSPQCSDEIYEIMTKCWKVDPAERPTFEDIYVSLQNMLMDNEKSYINIAQVIDEGTLTETIEPKIESTKDGSIRYTKA